MINLLFYLAVINKPQDLPQTSATGAKIQAVLQVICIALGALSVLFVTIGGLKYTMSQGEPTEVKHSKDTIMYAIIGLFISLGAYGIVTFVVDGVFK